jgi:hypothetical protein
MLSGSAFPSFFLDGFAFPSFFLPLTYIYGLVKDLIGFLLYQYNGRLLGKRVGTS